MRTKQPEDRHSILKDNGTLHEEKEILPNASKATK
jgi:hypothetical protein